MKVTTTRFGVIEIDDSSVVTLLRGPLGFEAQTRYCLIQHRPDMKFRWLQSIEDPSLAFVVVEASEIVGNYEFEISDEEAQRLHLSDPADTLALAIVTVDSDGSDVSANLAAPILINTPKMIGAQLVLQENSYSVKHPLVEQSDRSSEARRSTSGPKKAVSKAA